MNHHRRTSTGIRKFVPMGAYLLLLALGGFALRAGVLAAPRAGELAVAGSAHDALALAPTQDWQTLLHEDFEGEALGPYWELLSTDPNYEWGVTTCRAQTGERSAWAHGGGFVGPFLPCSEPYPAAINTWMIYGPFSLAQAVAAELELAYFVDSEAELDRLGFLVSIDGEEFFGWNESGGDDTWRGVTLDLDAVPELGGVLGEEQVWLAIAFRGDETGGMDDGFEGAYVDDVILRADLGAEPASPTPGRPTPEPTEGAVGSAFLPLLAKQAASLPRPPTSQPRPTAAPPRGRPTVEPTRGRPGPEDSVHGR